MLTPVVCLWVGEDEGDHGEGVSEGVGHARQLVGQLLQHRGQQRVRPKREIVEWVEAALRAHLLQPAQPLRRRAAQRRDADDAELPRAQMVECLRRIIQVQFAVLVVRLMLWR